MEVFLRDLKAKKQRELLIGVNNAENAFHHLKSYAIPDLQPTHDMINAITQQNNAKRKLRNNPFAPIQADDLDDGREDVKLPMLSDADVPLSVKMNEGLRNIKDQKLRDSMIATSKKNVPVIHRARARNGPKASHGKKEREFQWMLAEEEQAPPKESVVQAQRRNMDMYKQWKRDQAEQEKPYYISDKPRKSATCYWCRRLEKWCGWCHLPTVWVDPRNGQYATEGNDAWLRRPMSRGAKELLLRKSPKRHTAKKNAQDHGRSISSFGRIETQPFGSGTNQDAEQAETQQEARARARQMAAVSKEKIFEVMSSRKPVLFRMLTDSELVALSEMVTIRKFAAHEIVVKQGEETTPTSVETTDHNGNLAVTIAPAMYVALDGVFSVEVNYNNEATSDEPAEVLGPQRTTSAISRSFSGEREFQLDPNAEHVAQLTRGDAFGEFSLVTGCRRCCTVRASLPAAAIEVFRSDISVLLTRRAEVEAAKQHMIHNIKKTAGVVHAIHHEVDNEKRKAAQAKKQDIDEKFRHKAEMRVFGVPLTQLQREREWRSGLNARRLKKLWNEWMRDTYARVIQHFFRIKIGTRRLHRITEHRIRRVKSAKHIQRTIRGFLGRRAMLRELKKKKKPMIDFREVSKRRHREIREKEHKVAVRAMEDVQWTRDKDAESHFYSAFKTYVRAQKVEHCKEILNSIVSGTLLGFSFLTICETISVPDVALKRWLNNDDVVHKRREGESDAAFRRRQNKVAGEVEEAVVSWYEQNPAVLKLVGDWRNDLAGHEKEDKEQSGRERKFTTIKIDGMKSLQEILNALKSEERQARGILSRAGSAETTEGRETLSDERGIMLQSPLTDGSALLESELDASRSEDESSGEEEEAAAEAEGEGGAASTTEVSRAPSGGSGGEGRPDAVNPFWQAARRGFAPLTLLHKQQEQETAERAQARREREREEAKRRGHGRDRMLQAVGERVRKANAGFGVRVLFESMDRDADGMLRKEEMIAGFNVLKVQLNLLEVKETMAHLDPEHRGLVPVQQLIARLGVTEHAATTKGVELSEGGGFTGLVLAAERATDEELGGMTPSWDPFQGPIREDSSDDEEDAEQAERLQTFSQISDLAADLYSLVFPEWTDLDLAVMRDKVRCRVLYEIGPFVLPTGETHKWKTFTRMATVLRTLRQGLWKELIQEIINWDLPLCPVEKLEQHLQAVKKEMHPAPSAKRKGKRFDLLQIRNDLHLTLPDDPDAAPRTDAADANRSDWNEAIEQLSPALQDLVRRIKEHAPGAKGASGLRGKGARGAVASSKLGRKVRGKARLPVPVEGPELSSELVELQEWLLAHLADARAARTLDSERGRMGLERLFNTVWGIRALDHWVDGISSLYHHRAYILSAERQ